jgi:carbon monoxide dehydrogenase subunit G
LEFPIMKGGAIFMKLEGTCRFTVDRDTVWAALNDPAVLATATPGCKEFTPSGPDQYSTVLEMGVAGIKGKYKGRVAIEDRQAPCHYRLIIEGAGAPGFVKANLTFDLTPAGDDTVLDYSGEAQVGGLVAGVGQRILGGVAKMMMEQFFKAINTAAVESQVS